MNVETPSHDDTTTTRGQPACPVCSTPFRRVGRQRFCSDNCRKTAWARRHASPATPTPPTPPPGQRREATIYACPNCHTRYHAQQWCPDCHTPCTRIGLGGPCPHCDEPVAVTDLFDTYPKQAPTS